MTLPGSFAPVMSIRNWKSSEKRRFLERVKRLPATGYRLPAARCPQDSRDTAGGWLGLSGRKRDAGSRERFFLERVKGIEPSYRAWEARVLPLNYTRKGANRTRVTGR